MTIEEMFDKHEDEFLEFERIPEDDRRSPMPDVCAFIYLYERFGRPDGGDAVACAEHDEIHLGWHDEQLEPFSEDDAIYLHRCGVRCDEYGLCMFV